MNQPSANQPSASGMSLCAICCVELVGDAGLCSHHLYLYDDAWAVANRGMCDFLHRKKVPELIPSDQDEAA
jgi:hypothetical protein